MIYVRLNDEQGYYVEDAFVDELTEHTIETPCPDGFYHPRWDGERWVEGGTAPEPVQGMPSDSERITALEYALLAAILGGAV